MGLNLIRISKRDPLRVVGTQEKNKENINNKSFFHNGVAYLPRATITEQVVHVHV